LNVLRVWDNIVYTCKSILEIGGPFSKKEEWAIGEKSAKEKD
jgi:hypothetical protein